MFAHKTARDLTAVQSDPTYDYDPWLGCGSELLDIKLCFSTTVLFIIFFLFIINLYSVFTCCEHETSPRHVVLKIGLTCERPITVHILCKHGKYCAANYACFFFHCIVHFCALNNFHIRLFSFYASGIKLSFRTSERLIFESYTSGGHQDLPFVM